MSMLHPKDEDYISRGLSLMIPLSMILPIVFMLLFAFIAYSIFGGVAGFFGVIVGVIFGAIAPTFVYGWYLDWAEREMKAKGKWSGV